jgi:hypothetical protein
MRKTTVKRLTKEFEEGKPELVGYRVKTHDDEFDIHVVNAIRNPQRAKEIQKAANIQRGSKFFKQSFSLLGYSYNVSRK